MFKSVFVRSLLQFLPPFPIPSVGIQNISREVSLVTPVLPPPAISFDSYNVSERFGKCSENDILHQKRVRFPRKKPHCEMSGTCCGLVIVDLVWLLWTFGQLAADLHRNYCLFVACACDSAIPISCNQNMTEHFSKGVPNIKYVTCHYHLIERLGVLKCSETKNVKTDLE